MFVAGVLGFGAAVVLIGGASGRPVGVIVCAALYATSGAFVDLAMRAAPVGDVTDRCFAKALWVIASVLWLVVVVPLAALIAPDYRLNGAFANLATIVIVMIADSAVGRASPWRMRWRKPLE
jgi:hypothetical protein